MLPEIPLEAIEMEFEIQQDDNDKYAPTILMELKWLFVLIVLELMSNG